MAKATHTGRPAGTDAGLTGYLHPTYARAFEEFAKPRHLPLSGGWLLERQIPGSDRSDAMGIYPRFVCRDWSPLGADLDEAGAALVSLVLVTDPFAPMTRADLEACFDGVRPYKEHHIADLAQASDERTSRHHRYYARRALRSGISVERCDNPQDFVDEWAELYRELVERHRLEGLKRFSYRSFAAQLSVPGAVLFRAVKDGTTLAAQLWYVQGEIAYSHLQATAEPGYRFRAVYALYSESLRWLAERCRFADLGAAAGSDASAQDGLALFKQGWASVTRPAYLCTRVFDGPAYDALTRASVASAPAYFPAYRAGELT